MYIDDDDKRALSSRSRVTGLSEAELIRMGIKHVLHGRYGDMPSFIGALDSGSDEPAGAAKKRLRREWLAQKQ